MDRSKVKRAVYTMASTPDGQIFMDWLEGHCGKLLRKDKNGAVDPYAMTYVGGQKDLISDIKDMINDGKLAR